MHLSMGIQKAVFKFIIGWATEHKKGSTLQRRLAQNLGAVQDLKVAYDHDILFSLPMPP